MAAKAKKKRAGKATAVTKTKAVVAVSPARLPRWTPWGEYVQSYTTLYHCNYDTFGRMMGRVHMWATADEDRVRDIAEFGALPTLPEGMAIAYICGVGNALLLLPRIMTKEDPPEFISCKSRYWDYLDIVPENRGLPPIGWEDMKPVRELKRTKDEISGDGLDLRDRILSDASTDLDVIFGPPVELESRTDTGDDTDTQNYGGD